MTVVERLDPVERSNGVNAVSIGLIVTRSRGTRSSSAMIWLIIVFAP